MSKTIIIAAAASALLFSAPAFAQSKPHNPAFDGPHGSASDLTDRPSGDPTAARKPAFNGPHGSASDLTNRPPSDPTAAHRHPAFNGPHGSASDLTDRPPSDPTAGVVGGQYRQYLGREANASATSGHVKVFDGNTGAELRNAPQSTRRPGFDGPHGSATNLRDTPSSDPTARHIPRATLYGRKAGDDKRQDGKPARRPSGGLTKVGTGTLSLGNNH